MEERENIPEARRLGAIAYFLAANNDLLRRRSLSTQDSERPERIEVELRALGAIEPPSA